MASSLHSRGHMNGPPTSYSSSGMAQTSQYAGNAMRQKYNGGQQGLFPPPAPPPQPHNEPPQPNDNIMNRRGDENSSLYQICLTLRRRMAEVPGFEIHMAEMEEEEAEANDSTDPVTSMWNCLRRGYPLMTIYNALKPQAPLEVDASRMGEGKIGKAATFKFLQACLTGLKFPPNECFLITDLYGGDTTGFVKVTKVVNRVLDLLDQRGLLLHTERRTRNGDNEEPQTLTYRQNVVREIVMSERDYVQHLETLQHFKKELDESGAVAGDVLHDIFLNLNALLDFQRRFLIRIEQQNSLPESQQNWGQLFTQYKESFRVYEPFIANQVRCNNAVTREWEKIRAAPISSDLRGIVDVQNSNVLLGFLLKPFQRLSKYPLLLEELRKKGGLDEEHRQDLVEGMAAATSILHRANEAVAKEQRLAAVSELQTRVEDWKGHQIDHFGELMLFGTFTVLKGEGAKEVEREVREIFFSLTPKCRKRLRLANGQRKILSPIYTPKRSPLPLHLSADGLVSEDLDPGECTSPNMCTLGRINPNPHTRAVLNEAFAKFQKPAVPVVTGPKRFVSGLMDVPEEVHEDHYDDIRKDSPENDTLANFGSTTGDTSLPQIFHKASKPSSRTKHLLGSSPSPLQSPSTAPSGSTSHMGSRSPLPPSRGSFGSEGGSAPPTPSRSSRAANSGKLSGLVTRMRAHGKTIKSVFAKKGPARATRCPLSLFNGALKHGTQFLPPRMGHLPPKPFAHAALMKTPADSKMTNAERDVIDELALTRPVRIQYKVYLFERILLCCKEVNPNKPKNKMLGNTKPLVDKKGKLRLQLKGRIFMQNVTDVISVIKSDKSDYKIQIYWKGDPGVENFVIRFNNESDMNTWRDQVQLLKKTLTESARSSGQTGTSDTELLSMKDQMALKNPYIDDDAEDEDSQASTVVPYSSVFATNRTASSTSLRSAATHPNGPTRVPPPRFPLPDPAGVHNGPPLSVQTNFPPGTNSPGEVPGNSYFSPGGDSPQSTRSSSQTSMFGFSRQTTPRLSNEDNKHKTAPAMGRAPSRDGTRPMNGFTMDGRTVSRPSLPAMAGPQNAQQQLTMTQSRLRSVSTPDIHNTGGRPRYANGQLQPPVDVPVPPIPSHMAQHRATINRSQTSSPTNGALSARSNTQSPMLQRDKVQRHYQDQNGYDQQMQQRLQAIPDNEPRQYVEGSYADASLDLVNATTDTTAVAPTPIASGGVAYPSQLKVKIYFDPQPSHVTIVVPIVVKCRSLIDRIDSKMQKVSGASIAQGTARLHYTDSDGDKMAIQEDEDVAIAIEDWGESHAEQLRSAVVPDFGLYWQEIK